MARKLSMTLSDRRLCDEIKRRRLELGISQKDLAFAVGVSKNTVSAWECYLWTPSVSHICEMTLIFNCTLNDLLLEND